MYYGIKIMQSIFKKRLTKSTRDILAQGDMESVHQKEVEAVLQKMTGNGGLFNLGQTIWNYPLTIPFIKMISHSLILGATGSGKSYAALLMLVHSLKQIKKGMFLPMGFVDPKGELAMKANQYLQAFGHQLSGKEKEQFYRKIYVIDFSENELVTPYNILYCKGQSKELLINNRMETISELYQGGGGITPRMKSTLKYCLMLLMENELPITFFEKIFLDNDLVKRLASKSPDKQLKHYFLYRFDTELKSTIYGLRQRIDGLFVSDGVRMSLSGITAPDFRKLQDEGYFVILKLAGANINRSTTEFLLQIVLSDIKQSVFQRQKTDKPFLWHIDEAQVLYKDRTSRENMNDLLTMSRSFGSFFTLLCQSLSSSVRDKDILNSIFANVRWMLTFRSTPRDAQIISSAIPVFGKVPGSQNYMGTKITREQELKLRLAEISHFPERTGYLWLKSELSKAVKIRTKHLQSPYEFAGCTKEQFKIYLSSQKSHNLIPKQEMLKHLEMLESKLDAEQESSSKKPDKLSTSDSNNLMDMLEQAYSKKKG